MLNRDPFYSMPEYRSYDKEGNMWLHRTSMFEHGERAVTASLYQ